MEDELKRAAAKVKRAEAALKRAQAERDALVVAAIDGGMTHRAVAAAAGLSAGRPAQLRKEAA